jgi:RNA polymerase sigma-70 factor (ECF subfamily)
MEALGLLYERHAELAFRIAYRFVRDEQDAQDITQSVFVSLMQSARRYRPEAKVTTWIHRIVVNRCLNHRSRATGRQRMTSSTPEALAAVPAPEWERPDQRVERAEQTTRLREAVLFLPERQRMALLLRTDEGLSYAEIASVMGCSCSSIESLLFRARAALDKALRK